MLDLISEPAHEIARTSHSVIIKCVWDKESVVVKRILPTSRSKDRWQNEVNALSLLGPNVRSHSIVIVERTALTGTQPHIAALLFSHKPSMSMTLRYENGRSLNTFVDKDWMSTVPQQSCYQIFQQMADALAFIHARQMTHDDVKPENIMWSPEDCRAVLIDFGAALFNSEFTESGTPPYAAPEYLANIKTCKSDVWACGISIAFVLGYFPLPKGNWLLPNALQGDTKDRREMDEWLSFVQSTARDVIDRNEHLLSRTLRACPDARISSEELLEKLDLQIDAWSR
jgi:serine/threonine protein kinase